MNGQASPATRLHDVRIVNEQTGDAWSAAAAAIERGRIVVRPAKAPPPSLLDRRGSTFTITALDAAGRVRSFPHTTYSPDASEPPKTYVFV
ncbi:MAG: hypothetical protein QOH21_3193 [Acidobacteriota bacterium]|jgi:hypothetical protein|nr:hypothetical protein [Acidobacteriota bacterium]